MGIGKIDNKKFCIDFEEEIELSVDNENFEVLHIWEGYFSDIFCEPFLDGNGWHGFTRDYNQCEGAFDGCGETIITDLQEYIDDLKIYENRKFKFEETKEVYELIYSWLKEVQKNNCREIMVRVI